MDILIVLVWILNFGISWFNAWGVGRSWVESKAQGGFTHFVTWCAAIMSASGFTWCYTLILAFLASIVPYHGHPFLSHRYVQYMVELGYIVVIFPILGSGLGITISSWQNFRRERTLTNGGIAAYNTFAQISNIVDAVQVLPGIMKDLGGLFDKDSDSDSDNGGAIIVIALVAFAVLGGIFTTCTIAESAARAKAGAIREQLAQYR